MRMRKKKHCDERMARCEDIRIENPADYKGKWHELFGNDHPIYIEIGCGKGRFIRDMATRDTEYNFIAIEKEPNVIVMAMEKVFEAGLTNVRFCDIDADGICDFFEEGEVAGIYLNFSDPWKKNKQAKRRLTHKNFLDKYRVVLQEGGKVCFKTDNKALFEFSLNSFAEADYKMSNITLDLHNSSFEGNIMTEYEQRFTDLGQPIYRLEGIPYEKLIKEE